jgi:hypothetical protein
MRLNHFRTRGVAALLVAALVLFAHERYHLRLLLLLACTAFLAWVVFEIRHAYSRGHV